ncbi:MAG: PTS sugar transporter subunit IIA [Breznakia sp.]
MEKETKILLLTHGGWGMQLVESLGMILGKVSCTHEIPLKAEYNFSEYYEKVLSYVNTISENSLILTDLFGGTTSNVAAKIGKDTGIKVLSGLSSPLLLEACSQLQFQGVIDFEAVLKVGEESCKDVVKEIIQQMKKGEK